MRKLLAAALCVLALPSRAAQTLPGGRCRLVLTNYYAHQDLPSIDVPHIFDEDSGAALLNSLGTPTALDLRPRDVANFSPGLKFSGSYDVFSTVPQLDCGITDRLSITAAWPWFDSAAVHVRLEANSSILGYNIKYDPRQPVSLDNSPISLGTGSVISGGTEGAQAFLTNYFGYQRFQDFHDHGTGDPLLAATYGLVQQPGVDLNLTALAQIPLGRIADPDNPFAIPFSDGHVKLSGWAKLSLHDSPPYVIDFSLRYWYNFRDHPTLRIYRLSAVPLAGADSKEQVSRLQGAQINGLVTLTRTFFDGRLRPSLEFGYLREQPDSIRGSSYVSHYDAVIANTGRNLFSGEVALQYTSVDAFVARQAFAPVQVTYSIRVQVPDRGLFQGIAQILMTLQLATFF